MIEGFNLLLVIALVLANGFFVASEFALVGVRRSRIASLAVAGDKNATRLLGLVDNLNAYISATQLGITLSSLALGWIGEPAVAHLLEVPLQGLVSETVLHTISFTVAFGIITFLHIVLGELAPKTIALERAEKTALAIALPMLIFYKVFFYPIRLLDWAGTRTVRLFGLHPSSEHASVYTEEELRQLINISRESGHLEKEEQQLINRVFDFSDADVRDAMIPRVSVDAISSDATLEEVKSTFRQLGYSRLPVYRERLDNIVGVLFRRDIEPFLESPADFELQRLLHPPQYLPETAKLGQALRQMQRTRTHLAIVIDEHGGMEGIITLEDLLEEIVGEINDEYDEEVHDQITRLSAGRYFLDGRLAIRDINRELDLNLPEESGYTTLAGFLMAKAGRVLQKGEIIEHGALRFSIEKTERRRIRLIGLLMLEDDGRNSLGSQKSAIGAVALLLSVLISFSHGQTNARITDSKHRFSLIGPSNSTRVERTSAIIEFKGDEKTYGAGARYLLTGIRQVAMELKDVEGYMRSNNGIRMFDNRFIGSMIEVFPTIQSLDRRFTSFSKRPAIEGTFQFTSAGNTMKGRYVILLVSEQSSFYTFTWSADQDQFRKWNKRTQRSVESLEIVTVAGRDVAVLALPLRKPC